MSDIKERIRLTKERKKQYDSEETIAFESTDLVEYPDEKVPDEAMFNEKVPEEREVVVTEKEQQETKRSEEVDKVEFALRDSGKRRRSMATGLGIGVVLIIFAATCAAAWFFGFKSGEQKEVVEIGISTEVSVEAAETETESLEVPETEETEIVETEIEETESVSEEETEATDWTPILLNETLYLAWGPGEFSEDAVEYVIPFTPEGEGTDEYLVKIYDVSEELKVGMVVTDGAGNVLAGSPEDYNYSFGFYVNMTGGEDYNIIIRASDGAGFCSMNVMRMTVPFDFTNMGQISGFTDDHIFYEYHRFTAEKTGVYGFYLEDMDGGVRHKMSVLDDNGVVLMESPDGLENGMGFELELTKGFPYYILIEKYQGDGSYTLTAVKP